jgi:hypothetical protein
VLDIGISSCLCHNEPGRGFTTIGMQGWS